MKQHAIAFSHQGHDFIGQTDAFLLILKKEEELITSLTQFAVDAKLPGAIVHGIGALKQVELGYYELETQTYDRKNFTEDHELLSAHGNISLKEGKPFAHVHVSLGQADFRVVGGHLFSGVVAVTAELAITPLSASPKREWVPAIGLALICGV